MSIYQKTNWAIKIFQLTKSQRRAHHLAVMIVTFSVLSFNKTAQAQDNTEIFDMLKSAEQVLDAAIKEVTNGEYELPYELTSQDDFDQTLMNFQNAFESGDLETIAKWLPDATQLMTYMDSTSGLESYADWFRQRLDYAAVANEAIDKFVLTQPLRPPGQITISEQTDPKITILEPQSPKPTQPGIDKPEAGGTTIAKLDSRRAFVRDVETWSKKLDGRQAVASASELVPPLKKIFSAQGVPPELVWIAEVESTFNPAARSPAGAVGLFQLMPKTAEHLGLKTQPQDQRLDPIKNGRAAAKYLKDLHNRFDDWPLAIAAYNGGEGRVSKLLKKSSSHNLDAISDNLPSQTQMYVPKVLATIRHREGYDPTTRW